MTRTICALVGMAVGSLITPPSVLAVDGQVAITQAKAMAGGVTPGDTPGFPVSINLPGSYVLSSALTVPDADTHAIVINADHVTVDLNGFALLGPTDCSGGLSPCANAGDGNGIFAPDVRFNITVRGGTIQGMGQWGVFLRGDSHLVEYLHVRSNGSVGIVINASADRGGSVVRHNTVQRNGGDGISLGTGIVSDNTVSTNAGVGIITFTGGGLVLHNVVTRNRGGLALGPGDNYIGNVLIGNVNYAVLDGHNGGQNLCNLTSCPGAEF